MGTGLRSLAYLTVFAGLAASSAQAQVRLEPNPQAMVNPAPSAPLQSLFAPSGIFLIAGGVLPTGHTSFLLDGTEGEQLLAPGSIHAEVLPSGGVALRSGDVAYKIGMPPGLACPLGKFVARDGVIAYTIIKYMDPESELAIRRAGLARRRIAHEFDGTPFEALLKAADFGDAVPLDPGIAGPIEAEINQANGLHGAIIETADDSDTMIGSYINSDFQTDYHVYLEPTTQTVEIGGVPLRYYWKLERSGAAGVFAVDIYAQDWAPGTRLTDWTRKGAKPTQYDVVNFYQVAALFRELHTTDADGFGKFVQQACDSSL